MLSENVSTECREKLNKVCDDYQKVIASSKLPDDVVNAIKTILLSHTISLNASTNKSHGDKQHSKELNDKNLLSETTSCEDFLRFFMPIFNTNRSDDLEKTWISIATNLGSYKNIHCFINSLFIAKWALRECELRCDERNDKKKICKTTLRYWKKASLEIYNLLTGLHDGVRFIRNDEIHPLIKSGNDGHKLLDESLLGIYKTLFEKNSISFALAEDISYENMEVLLNVIKKYKRDTWQILSAHLMGYCLKHTNDCHYGWIAAIRNAYDGDNNYIAADIQKNTKERKYQYITIKNCEFYYVADDSKIDS